MQLRVLLFTTHTRDVDVVLEGLRQEGFLLHWVQVTTEADYQAWMRTDLDVVCADCIGPLPAAQAVHMLRAHGSDALFILLNSDRDPAATRACLQETHTYALHTRCLHTVGSVVQRVHGTLTRPASGASRSARGVATLTRP